MKIAVYSSKPYEKPFLDEANAAPHTLQRILSEGLMIAGWVAMWRPMQMYLYEWWPVRRRIQMFCKLSRMTVRVLEKQER